MDAFEQLVGNLLGSEGYWVKRSVKVVLTKEDKARIGRKSSPRWEIVACPIRVVHRLS